MKEKTYAAKQTRTIKAWFSHLGITIKQGQQYHCHDQPGPDQRQHQHTGLIQCHLLAPQDGQRKQMR